ncbi:hypothetical protein NC651_019968 [Populus alba x Populus x berolinensis]|nr:hypothetical protein NC651_019968 [Populus alba x Populus x berolinensis]
MQEGVLGILQYCGEPVLMAARRGELASLESLCGGWRRLTVEVVVGKGANVKAKSSPAGAMSLPLTHSTSPERFFKPSSPPLSSSHKPKPKPKSKEYFELTHPLPSDHLKPSCELLHHPAFICQHNEPASLLHPILSTIPMPPSLVPCSPRIPRQIQRRSTRPHLRLMARWLRAPPHQHGPNPENAVSSGRFEKDITRYSSLLNKTTLTLLSCSKTSLTISTPASTMLTSLSIFYTDKRHQGSLSDSTKGYWFIVEGDFDVKFEKVRFPLNTRKLVLELYVSFHGTDEFWYSNPSSSYIRMNNMSNPRGNGAFREVFVSIDGKLVGSEMPFPVIFTGGINPLRERSCFSVLDVTDGIEYWLVDANLHFWLDSSSTIVEAMNVVNVYPASEISRGEEFQSLDGLFEIKAEKFTRIEGWVKSSSGNLTTSILQEVKFRSAIKFKKKGTYNTVKQNIEVRREARVLNDVGGLVEAMTNQTYVSRDELGCYVRTGNQISTASIMPRDQHLYMKLHGTSAIVRIPELLEFNSTMDKCDTDPHSNALGTIGITDILGGAE